ncbi:hypothetical protein [Sphingobium yanoikuyae]|uniref:phage tail assembly chaperone n=1 Tax=Sphingobium yanoikuyae TaxID=13690 RepID=UPI0012DA2AAB|nr:hypothetical protein [Sphingobium yanoikuyae]
MGFKPGILEGYYKTASAYAERGEFTHSVFKTLEDEPEIGPAQVFYWQAFQTLASERPSAGFGGANRIPWSAVNAYAAHYSLTHEETEYLHDIIRAMDTEVLTASEKLEEANSKAKSKPK